MVSIYTNLGQNSFQAVESGQMSLRVGYCSEELEVCQGGRTDRGAADTGNKTQLL